MRRSLVVAFAVVAAVLLVTAQPAAAADAGLEVASQHTTNSDFNAAPTLTNVSVSGGDVALDTQSATIVDDYEDGDISEYSGDSGFSVQQTVVFHGQDALQAPDSPAAITSTSGLNDYPDQGDTFRANIQFDGGAGDNTGILFAVQSETDRSALDGYEIELNDNKGDLNLKEWNSGTPSTLATTSQTWNGSEWYELKVTWEGDGTITATAYNGAGDQVAQVSATDSTYSDGGVGVETNNAGSATAYIDYYRIGSPGGDTGQYVSANHSAEQVAEGWTNLSLTNASATVEWQRWDGSSWIVENSSTYTTDGNKTLDLSGSASTWRVNVTFENTTGSPTTAELHDEGVLFQASDPNGSNADPTGSVSNYDGDISLDVNDSDFGLAQGDSVTVEATNSSGSTIGTTTISSNQTVTFSHSALAGGNSVTWTLTDSYDGDQVTVQQDFSTPGTLYIRNETSPSNLVTGAANVTVQFFEGDTITERTTTDGTIDLSGISGDQTIVARVEADGWQTRTVVITSLFEQQSVYLLNNSVASSGVVFELSDPTGEFPPGETYLYVEKPITRDFDGDGNATTEYRVIAADTFGATAAYPITLANDARYRLRIRNDGSERALGTYTVTGDATEVLRVDRIEPSVGDQDTGAVYGGLEFVGNNTFLNVRFRGGDDNTTVEYRVENDSGTVIVPNTTVEGADFAHQYNVTAYTNSSTFNVTYTITRPDGSQTAGFFLAGQASGIAARLNINPQVLSIVSWGLILATLGLLVIVDARVAPAGGLGMASALTIMGTVAIPMPLLGVAGAVAVLRLFGGD